MGSLVKERSGGGLFTLPDFFQMFFFIWIAKSLQAAAKMS